MIRRKYMESSKYGPRVEQLESRQLLTTTLFEDSFEVNTWNGKWVEDSQNDWFRSGQRATDGSVSAEVDGYANNATLTMVTPVDLNGFASAELTFDWLIESRFDTGEYVSLDVSSDDGVTWQNDVRQLNGNVDTENTWHNETVDLTPYASSDVIVRFRAKASRSNEDANVDNVRIVATAPAGPPEVSISDTQVLEGDEQLQFLDDFVPAESVYPEYIAFGPDGNLYVAGVISDSVLRFDSETGSLIDSFVESGSGGLTRPFGIVFGPDANGDGFDELYVSDRMDPDGSGQILRYDGQTGDFIDTFVPVGSGGLNKPNGFVFGPDGNLYVTSRNTDEVLRYDGASGEYQNAFVTQGSGNLNGPVALTFGPDNNLYVTTGGDSDSVLRFDGTTGDFIDEFISAGSGGLDRPLYLEFGPDGHLYITSSLTDAILRYDGTTGDFINEYVAAPTGGLDNPSGFTFAADGNLYVSNRGNSGCCDVLGGVKRFGPSSQAVIHVSLSHPSNVPVTVDFDTIDGTALASEDFTSSSGTVVFDPGVTKRTIVVPTIDDAAFETTESFQVSLSSPSGATILDGLGIATILDDDPATPNDPPTANAGGPYATNEANSISLNGAGSSDSDGTIVTYEWDFDNDGNYDEASGLNPSFSSNQDGVFSIGLRVTDDDGDSSTDTTTVTVNNVAPIAEAGGPYSGGEGSNIMLDGSASSDVANDIVSYDWDLDNNGSFETAGTSVVFYSTIDGTYTVGLRVTDDAGAVSTDTAQVTVSNVAPTAHAGGPYATAPNVDVTVSAAASNDPGNDIVNYEWDLDDDGQFDDAAGVTATFDSAAAGNFTVYVRVTDDDGQSNTDSAIVTVSEVGPPTLDEAALVAHWTVDNTTTDSAPFGSVADNASLTGNAAFVTDATRGQVIELDGSGDRLDVADSTDLNKTIVTQRTISLWFNADEVTTRQVLFEEGGGTRGLSIYLDSGQLYVGGWNKPTGQSGWGGTFLSTAVTAGEWHNVVLTLDGTTNVQADAFKGYLNGMLFGSGAGSQIWNHSGDVGIGMMDDSTVFHDGNAGGDGFGFAGRMDDVRIYDRVFASDEVDNLWLNY